jgi:hypothetical protein
MNHTGTALPRAVAVHGSGSGVEHVTAPDPNPFADCHVIVFQGEAALFDRHLASTIHSVDDEIN